MKHLLTICVIITFVISACENKGTAVVSYTSTDSAETTSIQQPKANKQQTKKQEEEPKDSIPTVKVPCDKTQREVKNYKNDDAGVTITIESFCTGDYTILDTLEDYEGNLKITAHSSYEHALEFILKAKNKNETIARQLFLDSIQRHHFDNYVLVKPEITDFNTADTSAMIRFLFGPPDTDDVIYADFRVMYNNGVHFLGFRVPEYE